MLADKEDALRDCAEWDLMISLTQYRLVKTLYLLVDVEHTLSVTSKVLQTEGLTPTDTIQCLERLFRELESLKKEDGLALKEFHAEFDEAKESFKGINLEDVEIGEKNFKLDREELLQSLAT